MKYYLNFSDFEEFKKVFRDKLDEYNDEVFNLFKHSQEVEWVGLGHDRTIQALYKQIEEFNKISENLNKFLDFMDVMSTNYTEGIEDIKKKFSELEDVIHTGGGA